MGKLNWQILKPEHLKDLLKVYLETSASKDTHNKIKLSHMRKAHADAQAAIGRLLGLDEKGLLEAEDPATRGKLIGLRLQRDELSSDISALQTVMAAGGSEISPDKVGRFAEIMKTALENGTPDTTPGLCPIASDRGGRKRQGDSP